MIGRIAAGFLVLAAACGNTTEHRVAVTDFKFAPKEITVAVGDTVEWTNEDDVRHTVTSGDSSGAENKPDGVFDGDLAEKSATFSFTFERGGTFPYFCSRHNVMSGAVHVQEGGSA